MKESPQRQEEWCRSSETTSEGAHICSDTDYSYQLDKSAIGKDGRPVSQEELLIRSLDWTLPAGPAKITLDGVAAFAADGDLHCPTLHIAGTNGKGSLAWAVAGAAPKPCGRFTSPYIEDITECIAVDDQQISKSDAARLAKEVMEDESMRGVKLSAFDRLTVVAFRYFRERAVATAVVECGMGGRLDSTNIVHPTVCVITSVALDHMRFLGDTVEEIAREKGGIFKGGAHVILGPGTPALLDGMATEVGAATVTRLPEVEGELYRDTALRLARLVLPLVGGEAVEEMQSPPCRFEMHADNDGRRYILDAAHNPAGVAALCRAVRAQFPAHRVAVVFSAARDKPIAEMAAELRRLTPDVTQARGWTLRGSADGTPLEVALAQARKRAEVIVICGTFEIMGRARELVAAWADEPLGRGSRVLVVDHDDSFTMNLVHMLEEIGAAVTVVRAFDSGVDVGAFGGVLLSPGPGNPENEADIGISRSLVLSNPTLPVLGVCLGHQLLGHVYGARVQRAPFPMHGRPSSVDLLPAGASDPIFAGVSPQGFRVIRYHSLVVQAVEEAGLRTLAECKEADGTRTVMALRHPDRPHWGVQYHPESIGSRYGLQLLRNFLDATRRMAAASTPSIPRPVVALCAGLKSSPTLGLSFSWKALELDAPVGGLFEAFEGLVQPRVLLESSRVLPGFSRFSFTAGAPHLGPLSFTMAYHSTTGVVRCDGPGAPFSSRPVPSPEDFMMLISDIMLERAVDSNAPFDFAGGLVGYLGYEARHDAQTVDPEVPDAYYLFADRFLAYDHLLQKVYTCSIDAPGAPLWSASPEAQAAATRPASAPAPSPAGDPVHFEIAHSHEEYLQAVDACKEFIRSGESYELCLTTRLVARSPLRAAAVFKQLRELNPAPYGFMYEFPGVDGAAPVTLLGSSPERFLTVNRHGVAASKPMKGTARRDLQDPARDAVLKADLEKSEKDQAENLMIVDLVRHDLSSVCEPSSVRVPQLMVVESFATVHQMVSSVRGQLPPNPTKARWLPALAACFPAGSMTGAPKVRSMELLHNLEKRLPRTVYSGASGYISASGAVDTAVIIRTMLVLGGEAPRVMIGAGGAVTILSDSEDEYNEMFLKAERLLQAVAAVHPVSVDDGRTVRQIPAPASRAQREPTDPTLLETMLFRSDEATEPYLWPLHLARLARSCAALGIPTPASHEVLGAVRAAAAGGGDRRVRVLVDAQGVRAESTPLVVPQCFPTGDGAESRVVCLDLEPGANSGDGLLRHKTLWRHVYDEARRRVVRGEIFDVVLYNERHEVTETSIANIGIEIAPGVMVTPPVSCGLLPGVMREQLLSEGWLTERTVTVEELQAASLEGRAIVCFNSVRGVYPVRLGNDQFHGLRPCD